MGFFWSEPRLRLRTVWRLLLHGAAVFLLGIVPVIPVAEGLTWLHRRGHFLAGLSKEPYDMAINMLVGPLMTAGIVITTLVCSRLLDRRQRVDFIVLDRRWWADWLFGVVLGGTLMGAIFCLEAGLGWARITAQPRLAHPEAPLLLCLAFTLVKALCVGTYEEFVSRGYQLRNLAEALHRGRSSSAHSALLGALVLSSALFALLHVSTENTSVLSLTGLLFDGLLLGSAYLLTGQLGLCIGLHSGWNFFQGAIFGFPVSGDLEPGSLVQLEQAGPTWLTGGAYGPEGGLVGVLAAIVGVAAIAAWARASRGSGSLRTGIATQRHHGSANTEPVGIVPTLGDM
jgi:membrane protease YdiL (CAAX protease family)